MSDQYDFWRRRLRGEVVPIHDNDPQAGFYRLKRQDGTWVACAYWRKEDGTLRCRINGVDVAEPVAMDRWPWASKAPITHEVYQAVVVHGAPWPDQHEAVIRDRVNSQNAPDDNSFDALKDRIEDLVRDADKLIKGGAAKSQEEADRASDLANRLGELWKKGDESRKTEKQPHDEAAKAVQAKWLPLLVTAEIYKRVKTAVVTPFLVAEDRKRKEAEAAMRNAAAAAAQAGEPAPEPPPEAARPVKAGSGGRRSVALRTVKQVEIVDRAAVLAFFADSQLITELLQTMSERAVRAGATVPGVKVSESQVAA